MVSWTRWTKCEGGERGRTNFSKLNFLTWRAEAEGQTFVWWVCWNQWIWVHSKLSTVDTSSSSKWTTTQTSKISKPSIRMLWPSCIGEASNLPYSSPPYFGLLFQMEITVNRSQLMRLPTLFNPLRKTNALHPEVAIVAGQCTHLKSPV